MHLQFFYFDSEHRRVAAFAYHSNLSIILDIFLKKNTTFEINLCAMDQTADLKQFVDIIRRNTVIALLDEI